MQIEIEKKYNLTDSDYAIIKDKCEFIEEVNLKDYYLDKDFILIKQGIFLRLRNGKYELKIQKVNPETKLATSEEYETDEEVEQILSKYWLSTDDVSWIMFIDTKRKKYTYTHKWQKLNIDVEKYQYWTRYEIEIVYQEEWEDINRNTKEIELNETIEDFRKEIGLTAKNDISCFKGITCAMHQNVELYEIMTNNKI